MENLPPSLFQTILNYYNCPYLHLDEFLLLPADRQHINTNYHYQKQLQHGGIYLQRLLEVYLILIANLLPHYSYH